MKSWKYLLLSLVAVLVLMMVGGIALADEDNVPAIGDEATIARTPVYPLFKNGTVSINALNQYVVGTFKATYWVDYSVTNGVYTVNSSSATYNSFSGTVLLGDFYGNIYVTHNVSKTGLLSIIINYQVRQTLEHGSTSYSGPLQSSISIQLPAQ